MTKIKINRELESSFVKSIAKNILYRYRTLAPFKSINPDDIIFIRDETLKANAKKDIEIYTTDASLMAITGIKFIVIIGKSFDEITKHEQDRKVFHILCHIPSNYKQQYTDHFKVSLRQHDLELFEEESTFIHDIATEETERDKKDEQKFLRRSPLPY